MFLKSAATASLALASFFSPCSALAIRNTTSSTPPVVTTNETTQAFVDLSGSEYNYTSSTLIANGYKPISLSVYGSPAKYSSVWTKDSKSGPMETIYDADYNQYMAWMQKWNAAGYVSTQLAVSGASTSEAVFAGVMEQKYMLYWLQLCDLDNPWNIQNETQGQLTRIAGYSMYGTPMERKYCILVHANQGNVQETSFFSYNSFINDFETTYESELKKRFWRPTRLYLSADHVITPVFQDTQVGKWEAFSNLTLAELQTQLVAQKAAGRVPIDIQGGGYSVDDVLYTAIFAEKTEMETRKWTAVGEATGFQDNEKALTELDWYVQNFMDYNGIRQAQVAASVNGSLIVERAYTLAEEVYPVVGNDDVFMLASVSKMFLYAAVTQLLAEGAFKASDKVYELLGYTQFGDARSTNITVQNLLDHKGGYNREVSGDPMNNFRGVGLALNLTHAATLRDMIEYMITKPLDSTPGQYYSYSNYGNMVLSYLVTNVTGIDYYTYLQKNVFDGADVRLYATDAAVHANDTVVQQSPQTGYDPRILDHIVMVPAVAGGDGIIKEAAVGAVGLATSAKTLSRFVATHAAWGTGGRTIGFRDGTMEGCRTYVESRANGVDFAFVINSRAYTKESSWIDMIGYGIPHVFDQYALKA